MRLIETIFSKFGLSVFHFSIMSKQEIKEKCNAYRNMVVAEAKFIEAKEYYYEVNK